MKKKLVILLSVVLFFSVFSQTSYAAAVKKKIEVTFGAYTLQKDGKDQKVDNIYYNKKVYIPVGNINSLTGATVSQSKNTINITSPIDSKINRLKLYTEYQNLYESIEDVASMITDLSKGYSLAFYEIERAGTTTQLVEMENYYSSTAEVYNSMITRTIALEKRAKAEGYSYKDDTNLINTALNQSYDALEYATKAHQHLERYSMGDDAAFDLYLYESKNLFDSGLNSQKTAWNGYNKYTNLIRNFK